MSSWSRRFSAGLVPVFRILSTTKDGHFSASVSESQCSDGVPPLHSDDNLRRGTGICR